MIEETMHKLTFQITYISIISLWWSPLPLETGNWKWGWEFFFLDYRGGHDGEYRLLLVCDDWMSARSSGFDIGILLHLSESPMLLLNLLVLPHVTGEVDAWNWSCTVLRTSSSTTLSEAEWVEWDGRCRSRWLCCIRSSIRSGRRPPK